MSAACPRISDRFHCSSHCFFHCFPLFLRRRIFSKPAQGLALKLVRIFHCKSIVFFSKKFSAAVSGSRRANGDSKGCTPTRDCTPSWRQALCRAPSAQWAADFCPGVGLSSSFCTRQFRISATSTVFSFGHAISWIQPNCLSCLPDSPSQPSTLPSSESL